MQGLNPFSECKQHVFKERGIDDDEVRKILCSNEEEDEEVSNVRSLANEFVI